MIKLKESIAILKRKCKKKVLYFIESKKKKKKYKVQFGAP